MNLAGADDKIPLKGSDAMSKLPKDALIAEIVDACADPKAERARDQDTENEYSALLSPCEIGSLRLSNRCVASPLDLIGGKLSPDEEVRRFYLDRAGAGLLTTGPVPASLDGGPFPLLRWCGLNETLHAKGCRIFLQIALDGSPAKKAVYLASAAPVAAFDGICLYARENDAEAAETVRGIRERLGASFPILYRASLSSALAESGLTPRKKEKIRSLEENLRLLTELARAGVDAFEAGLGGPGTPWLLRPASQMPEACFAEAARALKAHLRYVGLPLSVLAFGRLSSPARCEELLDKGDCDLISLDGAGLGDPDWMKKAAEGRAEGIVPLPLPEDPVAEDAEKIAVVGAGRRGLCAAIRAADAGCRVDLYEASDVPGGRLRLYRSGASLEKQKELALLTRELAKRPQIRLLAGTRADTEHLRRGAYDQIVFACRAAAITAPNIPGWGEIPFEPADRLSEALSGKWKRRHVAVFGSDALACELAWRLLSEGLARRVLLVTEKDGVMAGEPPEDRAWFLHHFPLRGGTLIVGCTLQRLLRHTVFTLDPDGNEQHVRCDRILLAEEAPASLRLYEEALRERPAPDIRMI